MLSEDILIAFFNEEIDAQELQEAFDENDDDDSHYTFRDMDSIHYIEPQDLIPLCEAVEEEEVNAGILAQIAEVLRNAEQIEWDSEIITEICYRWLDPIEYDLIPENAPIFKRWLAEEEDIPND